MVQISTFTTAFTATVYTDTALVNNSAIIGTVLEIAAGHWPFSDQFQHLANQNSFWPAKFTVHFQWEGHQHNTKSSIFKKQPTNF